jgi:hypothetical protein
MPEVSRANMSPFVEASTISRFPSLSMSPIAAEEYTELPVPCVHSTLPEVPSHYKQYMLPSPEPITISRYGSPSRLAIAAEA